MKMLPNQYGIKTILYGFLSDTRYLFDSRNMQARKAR